MRLTIALLVACSTLLALIPAGATQGETTRPPIAPCDLDTPADSAPSAGAAPLDGLLGGTRASFVERYGEPTNTLVPEYTVGEDCGTVILFYYDGTIVTDIGVFSPRESTEEDPDRSGPHEADWSIDEAMAIAESLLPPDIVANLPVGDMSPPEPKMIGEPILVTGTSEMMCQHVPAAAYEPVDDTPICGGFSYTMHRTTSGDVTWIEIDLEIGDEPT